MAQYKPKSSEESSPEEKILKKGWLEITKKVDWWTNKNGSSKKNLMK